MNALFKNEMATVIYFEKLITSYCVKWGNHVFAYPVIFGNDRYVRECRDKEFMTS